MIYTQIFNQGESDREQNAILDYILNRTMKIKESVLHENYVKEKYITIAELPRQGELLEGYVIEIYFQTGDNWRFEMRINPNGINNPNYPKVITRVEYTQIYRFGTAIINKAVFYPTEENHLIDRFYLLPNSLYFYGRAYVNINETPFPGEENRDSHMVQTEPGSWTEYRTLRLHEVWKENNRVCLKNVETGQMCYASFTHSPAQSTIRQNVTIPYVRLVDEKGKLIPYRTMGTDIGFIKNLDLPYNLIEFYDSKGDRYTVLFSVDEYKIIAQTVYTVGMVVPD